MKKLYILFLLLVPNFLFAQSAVQEFLDINNIKAGFLNRGDMFWNPDLQKASFEYPKGSGKHCNFGNVLWIAGKNKTNNAVHVAAQGWRSIGDEYWPGPLDSSGNITQATSDHWDQIWKVNLSAIQSFLAISNHTLGNTPKSILEWPAKGNPYAKTPTNGSLKIPDRDMAPFVDINNDGEYNPLQGDYPKIKGEQMLWWIMNDNLKPHLMSKSPALKIEIHAAAYACNTSMLDDYIFLDLQYTNRGNLSFDSTIFGLMSEGDIGKMAFDDFMGFDSTRRMGIMYNGDAYDEGINGYGYNIPQMGTMLLSSPNDNANFREAVGAFTFMQNSGGRDGWPANGQEHFNYLTGQWRDGTPFKKDCDPLNGSGPHSPYVFPGDPQDHTTISEPSCNTIPYNRRFVLSTQPVEFTAGETKNVTYCFLVANMGNNPYEFTKIKHKADLLLSAPQSCANSKKPTAVQNRELLEIRVYPNPSENHFIVEDINENAKNISLYDAFGRALLHETKKGFKIEISTSHLPAGIYYLKVKKQEKQYAQSITVR